MKSEYKLWFLQNITNKVFTLTHNKLGGVSRKYEYFNFSRTEVPFDTEFFEFLKSYVGQSNFTYDAYHIHRWKSGYFFDEHIDDRADRKFSYVAELKESECKTKLLVENYPSEEAWFDVRTKHTVPKVKEGERISLTVFGKKIQEIKGLI